MVAQIVTIAQQKGGAGKTTLAAHLSVAWREMGYRIAVLDLDPQASLTQWMKLRSERQPDENVLSFAQVQGKALATQINRFQSEHELIVIDSPPHVESDARHAMRVADLVVVPMQPSPLDLWATQATLKLAQEEGVPVKMVLNRVNQNSRLSRAMEEEMGSISPNKFGNRVLFAGSLMTGCGVTELAPYSQAGEEVSALAGEIIEYLDIKKPRRGAERKRA